MIKLKWTYLLIVIVGFLSCAKHQSFRNKNGLQFVTIENDLINVHEIGGKYSGIFFNGKLIYQDSTHDFIYLNKSNRIIEGKKGISLFLYSGEAPDFDKIIGFQVTKNKAILKAEACFYGEGGRKDGPAPFTDIDGDGLLEFGGVDITEVPPSYPDSIYYNPSEFYEIKEGEIRFDKELTIKKDIEENGLYIEHPLDKEGFCCVVIPNPKIKK